MTPAQLLSLAVVAWLPGAVIFRLPAGGRDTRAGIDAEERVFWSVILSLCVSLSVVLALAAAHRYTFARLLIADGLIALALAGLARFRLRLGPAARRPGPWSLLPVALVLLGLWRFFPASEYVMGGKDPGVYINEGIQIAQRGTLVYDDPVVAAVPPGARDLFFPSHQRTDYYSVRFMGFWIQDPDSGAVVGQFPHLFPASIAIGYGIDGLSGARRTSGVWAILGLLAVYFAARRIVGNTAAGAAAALLALHVIQVWFARYPNAEVVMQALLFAAMLASARAHADDDRFFGPVAGGLLGLLLFLRFDAVLGIAAVGAAIVLSVLRGGRLRWPFVAVLAAAAALAVPYFAGPLRGYADLPIVWLTHLRWWTYALLAAAAALAGVALAAGSRWPAARRAVSLAPVVLGGALAAGAVYALNYRHPAGKLAEHDAYALRTFTYLYATLPAIVAALLGFVTTARRREPPPRRDRARPARTALRVGNRARDAARRIRRHHPAARKTVGAVRRPRPRDRRIARRRVRHPCPRAAPCLHLRAQRPRAQHAAARSRRVRAVPRVGAGAVSRSLFSRRRRNRPARADDRRLRGHQ